jgi:hypothetical protein
VSADLHPQVRALLEAALAREGEPGPPDLEAERAAYLQTALELGGAIEPVARIEDVVIPDAEGAACGPAPTLRPSRPSRSACSSGCTGAAGTSATSNPSTA